MEYNDPLNAATIEGGPSGVLPILQDTSIEMRLLEVFNKGQQTGVEICCTLTTWKLEYAPPYTAISFM